MSERETLIGAAVQPLAGNIEHQLAAKRVFDEVLPGDDPAFPAILRRWRQTDERRFHGMWRLLLLGLTLLLALAFPVPVRSTLQSTLSGAGLNSGLMKFLGVKERIDFGEGKSGQELRLLGKPGRSKVDQAKELWDADPANPVYFANYSRVYSERYRALPPDYFTIAGRIDPANAWFDYFAAGVSGQASVDQLEVLDEEKFQEALRILRRAEGKSRAESYRAALQKARVPLLRQQTPGELFQSTTYLIVSDPPSRSSRWAPLVLAAHINRIVESGDVEGFLETERDVRQMMRMLAFADETDLFSNTVLFGSMTQLNEALHDGAVKLKLPEAEDRLAAERRRIDGIRLGRPPAKDLIESHGGILASRWLGVAAHFDKTSSIRAEDLRPARLAEHAWFSMVGVGLVAFYLGCCIAGAIACRLVESRPTRLLAKRMEALLLPVDWGWILGAGVVLPVILMAGWILFTPFGGRGLTIATDIRSKGFGGPLIQWLLQGLCVPLLSILIARWRYARRAGVFGFSARFIGGWCLAVGWWIFAMAYSAIPQPRWAGGILFTAVAAWMLWDMRRMFGGGNQPVVYAACFRAVLPAWAIGMLLMMAAAVGFKAEGDYWVRQEKWMKPPREGTGSTAYEYQVGKAMREDIRALFE